MCGEESLDLEKCWRCVNDNAMLCEILDNCCDIHNKLYKLNSERFNITNIKSKNQLNTAGEFEINDQRR